MRPVGSRPLETEFEGSISRASTIRNKGKKQENLSAEPETLEFPVIRKGDMIEISNTSKAFSKLDNFLNLGKKDRLDISDLNEEERKEFLKMLSGALKNGIVGYEVLEINGRPEKHFIVNQIGNKRTYGARLYRKRWPGEGE